MPRYFVDTFYWVALSDPRDQWHARVLAFSRSLSDYHLYTVDEVLAEYLTFYSASRPHVRGDAVQTVRDILHDLHITVIPQSHASFLDAFAFYASRLDKQYMSFSEVVFNSFKSRVQLQQGRALLLEVCAAAMTRETPQGCHHKVDSWNPPVFPSKQDFLCMAVREHIFW